MGNSNSNEVGVNEISVVTMHSNMNALKSEVRNIHQRIQEDHELLNYQTNLFTSVIAVLFIILATIIVWLIKRADRAEKRHKDDKAAMEQRLKEERDNEREKRESERRKVCILEENLRQEELRNMRTTFEMQMEKLKIEYEKRLTDVQNQQELHRLKALINGMMEKLDNISSRENSKNSTQISDEIISKLPKRCNKDVAETGSDCDEVKTFLSSSFSLHKRMNSPD